MEIWVIASVLGVGEPEPVDQEGNQVGPRPAMAGISGPERVVARMLAAEGKGPTPEPDAPSAAMMGMFADGRVG